MGAQGDKDGQGTGGTGDQKIRVGEKEYSAADIGNLVADSAAATQKAQEAAKVIETAKAYGLSPEDFAQQAIAGLTVVSSLIDKGVINNQGELVAPPKTKSKEDEGDELEDIFNLKPAKKKTGDDALQTAVAKALEGINSRLNDFGKQIQGVSELQTGLIHSTYEKEIIAKFPTLDKEDVNKVFALAKGDRTKTVWDHAKAVAEAKGQTISSIQRAFAEKHGLNYEDLVKAKELNEQGAKGGFHPLIAEGKKISFKPGKDNIAPVDLAINIFKSAQGRED